MLTQPVSDVVKISGYVCEKYDMVCQFCMMVKMFYVVHLFANWSKHSVKYYLVTDSSFVTDTYCVSWMKFVPVHLFNHKSAVFINIYVKVIQLGTNFHRIFSCSAVPRE